MLQLDGSGEAAARLAVRRALCRGLVRPADPGRIHAPDTPERSLNTSGKQSQALLSCERGNKLDNVSKTCM